jgi:hypothetical protein
MSIFLIYYTYVMYLCAHQLGNYCAVDGIITAAVRYSRHAAGGSSSPAAGFQWTCKSDVRLLAANGHVNRSKVQQGTNEATWLQSSR